MARAVALAVRPRDFFCRHVTARALLLVCGLCLPGTPASGQIAVLGDRDLNFGAVTAGVTTIVSPADAVKSGQWTITAPIGTRIRLRMTTPVNLLGPGSATLPVAFLNGDAFIQEIATGSLPDYFNPKSNVNFQFENSNQAMVRLGGRASPTSGQTAGGYANTATITITVVN